MPTVIYFVGPTNLKVREDFEKVTGQLSRHDSGLFTLENSARVTVFKTNVLYLEEPQEGSGARAAGFN